MSPYGPREPSRRGEGVGRMSTAAAVILFAAVTIYAVFGGADFGAGFWDLMAGGTERGERPREVIDHSIGPVWEANHVWLIFVLRGAVDVLPRGVRVDHPDAVRPAHDRGPRHRRSVARASPSAKPCSGTRDRRNFGAAFALSSVLVPYCLGAVAGGIASGRVPAGGVAGDPWTSWMNPTSIIVACSPCASPPTSPRSSSVWDARRFSDDGDGRRTSGAGRRRRPGPSRASCAGRRARASAAGPPTSSTDSPLARCRWSILSVVCRARRAPAPAAETDRGEGAAGRGRGGRELVLAWGVAQWDYLLPRR